MSILNLLISDIISYLGEPIYFYFEKKFKDLNDIDSIKDSLSKIPEIENDDLDEVAKEIIGYKKRIVILDDLMRCILIAKLQLITTTLNVSTKFKITEDDLPSERRFIHYILIQCARELFVSPHLLSNTSTEIEKQRNTVKMTAVISASINKVIIEKLEITEHLHTCLKDYDASKFIKLEAPTPVPPPATPASSTTSIKPSPEPANVTAITTVEPIKMKPSRMTKSSTTVQDNRPGVITPCNTDDDSDEPQVEVKVPPESPPATLTKTESKAERDDPVDNNEKKEVIANRSTEGTVEYEGEEFPVPESQDPGKVGKLTIMSDPNTKTINI